LVAVDLLAGRSRDHGGLAAKHPGLGMFQGRTVGDVPGRGAEAVAIALLEACFPLTPALSPQGRGGVPIDDRLLQHLRLAALVMNFSQQPEVVPLPARMLAHLKEMPAAQRRLLAVALG